MSYRAASRISDRIEASLAAIASLREQADRIEEFGSMLITCLQRGGTIYTCGNGGSAAEALHLAEELIGRYRGDRPPLRALCLNADPTALTCIANDFGFEQVFARQCEALLTPADVLVVFSTSGASANIIAALRTARARGVDAIGLLGRDGGECAGLCSSLIVRSNDSAHVQEAHQVVLHLLCELIEAAFAV
jgi:D-sedoheptulose 7-phosphate isomerase